MTFTIINDKQTFEYTVEFSKMSNFIFREYNSGDIEKGFFILGAVKCRTICLKVPLCFYKIV